MCVTRASLGLLRLLPVVSVQPGRVREPGSLLPGCPPAQRFPPGLVLCAPAAGGRGGPSAVTWQLGGETRQLCRSHSRCLPSAAEVRIQSRNSAGPEGWAQAALSQQRPKHSSPEGILLFIGQHQPHKPRRAEPTCYFVTKVVTLKQLENGRWLQGK